MSPGDIRPWATIWPKGTARFGRKLTGRLGGTGFFWGCFKMAERDGSSFGSLKKGWEGRVIQVRLKNTSVAIDSCICSVSNSLVSC